jgi:hypothetical protein
MRPKQSAPTPFPVTPDYGLIASNIYSPDAITVPAPTGRRQLAGESGDGKDADKGEAHGEGIYRLLAMTPVQACYSACYTYYSPPPNNAKFIFQLVDINGALTCQCCKTCENFLPQQGALLMEACVPNTALRLSPSVSRKFVKVNGTKPAALTYKLRVRGVVPGLRLDDMGVR